MWRLLLHDSGQLAGIFPRHISMRTVISDRIDRAAIQRIFAGFPLFVGFRLPEDKRMGHLVVPMKNLGSTLLAEFAVDALVIDVIGSGTVVWKSVLVSCHGDATAPSYRSFGENPDVLFFRGFSIGPMELVEGSAFFLRQPAWFAGTSTLSFRKSITQLGAGGFNILEKLLDFLRVVGSEISLLGDIFRESVQLEFRHDVVVSHRGAAISPFAAT